MEICSSTTKQLRFVWLAGWLFVYLAAWLLSYLAGWLPPLDHQIVHILSRELRARARLAVQTLWAPEAQVAPLGPPVSISGRPQAADSFGSFLRGRPGVQAAASGRVGTETAID